ncbi:unnamed protein product [Caenorhabditis nigoni]
MSVGTGFSFEKLKTKTPSKIKGFVTDKDHHISPVEAPILTFEEPDQRLDHRLVNQSGPSCSDPSAKKLENPLKKKKVGLTGNTTFHNTCPSEDDIEYTIRPVYEIIRTPISTEDVKKDVTDVLKKYDVDESSDGFLHFFQ